MILREGALAEIYSNKKVVAAYCCELRNTSAKLLLESGKTVKTPSDKVLYVSPSAENDMSDLSVIEAYLRRVNAARDEIADSVPVADIWELCLGEMESFSPREIAEMWFGDSCSDDELAGLQRALIYDAVYFRRKGDRFVISSAERVGEIVRMREAETRKRARLDAFAAAAADVLSGRAMTIPPEFADYVSVLSDASVADPLSGVSKAASELCAAAGIREDGIFDFLVRASVFSRDENLLLREYGICREFPEDVERECMAIPDDPPEGDCEDCSALHMVTIDNERTTDIDDGVSLERLGGGRYRVGVHITDVSAMIPVDSPADREAFKRATSIYMPDLRIDMLPSCVSEMKGSLAEGRRRRALSFFFTFRDLGEGEFEIEDSKVMKTVVASSERLTYDAADEIISHGDGEDGPSGDLALLYRIALSVLRNRVRSGAVSLARKRIAVHVRDGVPEIEVDDSTRPSAVLVSEFMILYNVSAAEFCHANGIPVIYRNQPAPSGDLSELEKIDLNSDLGLFKARRFLKKSSVSSEASGHFSIGVRRYLQATSPLRRYADLTAHRQIKSFLETGYPMYSRKDIDDIIVMTQVPRAEAETLEKTRTRYWLLRYIEINRCAPYRAMVLKAGPDKLIVRNVETGLESEVAGDPLKYHEGQTIDVAVKSVSAKANTVKFSIVQGQEQS